MTAIRYPSEFTSDPGTDYLRLDFVRRNYSQTSASNNTGGNSFVNEAGLEPIILNVPQKVTEQMSQQFANASLGDAGPVFRGEPYKGFKKSEAFGNAIKRLVENFALGKSVEVANKLGASQLTDNGILSATSGIVFNPNMEVLYEGPDFRRFNFQFSLFTKSEKDAVAIKSIVDTLRAASLPKSKGSIDKGKIEKVLFSSSDVAAATAIPGALGSIFKGSVSGVLKSLLDPVVLSTTGLAVGNDLIFTGETRFITQPPFICVTYMRGAKVHPFIRPLLPAAINSINFDFTPTGNYTQLANYAEANKNGNVATTVGVTITMQVTEINNLFSDTELVQRARGANSVPNE
jgi:hypothetical protein